MKTSDFEAQFGKIESRTDRVFKFAFVAWVIWALAILSLIGGFVYAAIHFIGKYW